MIRHLNTETSWIRLQALDIIIPTLEDIYQKLSLTLILSFTTGMPAPDAEAEYDAFEARLKFSVLLGSLSASVAAAQKAARFLMVNKHCGEDLFEVALEWLERVRMLCFPSAPAYQYRTI